MNDCSISKNSLQKIKENCNLFFKKANKIYDNKVLKGIFAVQIAKNVIYIKGI